MIQFAHVTKSYPTGQVALSDVSFEISPGEFVFLVGESGAGKTTIMRLLTKDLEVTEGTIQFYDTQIQKLKKNKIPALRRSISVVFQDYKLLPERTIAENIGLPLEIAGKQKAEIDSRVKDLLNLVGLEGKELYFPAQLSGGEAQRVGIARALSIGPKVVFADEPTGNLDRDSSIAIAKLLHKIHELGTTVIMATHNHELLKLLKKREIHLHKGKVISDSKEKHHEEKAPDKEKEPEKEGKKKRE